MIVRPRPTGFGLIFLLRGSVLPTIAPRLIFIGLIAILAVGLHHLWPGLIGVPSPAPFTMLGLSVPIFLGFRNNACYDRWWEGRKQWGALIAASRNFLRDLTALLPEEDLLHRQGARLTAAFASQLRHELRGTAPARPGRLLTELAHHFGARQRDGRISDITYRLFSDHLGTMAGIQSACERLRGAPMPFAYSLMLHRMVWLFCILLPFGMVDTLGICTPVLSLTLAYSFLGLDALGEELEAPFSDSANGLPLDAMVRAIEIAVAEALGETPPEPLAAKDFVLL